MADTGALVSPRSPILLVTRNLPPLRGGMERLNQHLALELNREFALCIVGPAGCSESMPADMDVREARVRPLWQFLSKAMIRAVAEARKRRPVLVLAGSGLTAPIAVVAAWFAGGRSAVYAHGLDLVVRHPLYRALWLPFIRRCDLCLVNSRHTADLARRAGLRPERITILHPGVTMPLDVEEESVEVFRRTYKLGSRKLLLSVGRLTERKGLHDFVERALRAVVDRHPDALLVIIGDEAPDALSGANAGGAERVLATARSLGLDDYVRVLGACSDETLSAAYAAADACIFPLRQMPGDVEGFGMVAVEAAAHGLATVAFDVGGVADAVSDGVSGWLVQAGDYVAFAERVVQVLSEERSPQHGANARAFARGFDWHYFGTSLRRRIRTLLAGEDVL